MKLLVGKKGDFMKQVVLNFIVNDVPRNLVIKPYARLLDVIREDLGLTGTKEGCGVGECGACTVIVDGETVNSCHTLAASMEGKSVVTIEGLESESGEPHTIQKAYVEKNAIQCGFCTPGFVMSTKALLDKTLEPTKEEIDIAISGNICRCTGYEQIVDAIEYSASELKNESTD